VDSSVTSDKLRVYMSFLRGERGVFRSPYYILGAKTAIPVEASLLRLPPPSGFSFLEGVLYSR